MTSGDGSAERAKRLAQAREQQGCLCEAESSTLDLVHPWTLAACTHLLQAPGANRFGAQVGHPKRDSGVQALFVFFGWFHHQPFTQKGFDETGPGAQSTVPGGCTEPTSSGAMHWSQQPFPFLPKVAPLSLSKPPTPKSCHQSQAGPDTADGR